MFLPENYLTKHLWPGFSFITQSGKSSPSFAMFADLYTCLHFETFDFESYQFLEL